MIKDWLLRWRLWHVRVRYYEVCGAIEGEESRLAHYRKVRADLSREVYAVERKLTVHRIMRGGIHAR